MKAFIPALIVASSAFAQSLPRAVVDSRRDTIVVRVSGAVPAAAVSRLEPEMKIAPAADDTSSFTNVAEFDVDRRGFIWAYDIPGRKIFLFDSLGREVRRIGRRGPGPGEFQDNGGMVVLPDGRLAQWDPANARISFFAPGGALVASWPLSGGFRSDNNIFADSRGRLYFRRQIFGPGGRGRSGPGETRTAFVRLRDGGTPEDTLFPAVFPIPNATVSVRNGNASMTLAVPFAPRSLYAWHAGGFLVAGDGSRYQITIPGTTGKTLRIERIIPAVPVSADEREAKKMAITYFMRRTDPGWTWQGPDIPAQKPPLEEIFVDRDGRIWAQVAVASVRVPDDEVPPRPAGVPVVAMFRAPEVWEVFSPSGSLLARVELPARGELIQASGDRIWILGRDDDDLPAIMRFRVRPGLGR